MGCAAVKSPLWLHYLAQPAAGPYSAKQTPSIYLSVCPCLFCSDSVWVIVSPPSLKGPVVREEKLQTTRKQQGGLPDQTLVKLHFRPCIAKLRLRGWIQPIGLLNLPRQNVFK